MTEHKAPSQDLTSLLSDMVSSYQHPKEAAATEPEAEPAATPAAVTVELVSAPVVVAAHDENAAVVDDAVVEPMLANPVPAASETEVETASVLLAVPEAPVTDVQPPVEEMPPLPPLADDVALVVPDVVLELETPHDSDDAGPASQPETHAATAALPESPIATEPVVNTASSPETAAVQAAPMQSAALQKQGLAAPVQIHPLLEKMAVEAVRLNASDIFISTDFAPSFKVDSVLTPLPLKPLTKEEAAKIVFSTMNDAQRETFAKDLELNYSLQAKNGVRFRVNAYHEQSRIGLVMRRITTEIATVDDLFLPQALKDLAMQPRGLIILAGATGSGKSTSMAAMIDWRNEHAAGHIVTIEDPIEYIHRPKKSIITHREVGIDTLSWSNAVQSAMRQAPDVVCVGEVRNALSLEYAMQLAQTGHLCFFTIHASNASQAVERIINLFPEERHEQVLMDLALNLVCIIGQRLVIKKGGKGRRAIVDLLINTPAMQDYVFKGQFMEMRGLMEKAEQDGMQTFDQDLFELYCEEIIDYDEALRQAESVNDLRLRIKLYEEGRASEHIFERVDDLNLM